MNITRGWAYLGLDKDRNAAIDWQSPFCSIFQAILGGLTFKILRQAYEACFQMRPENYSTYLTAFGKNLLTKKNKTFTALVEMRFTQIRRSKNWKFGF